VLWKVFVSNGGFGFGLEWVGGKEGLFEWFQVEGIEDPMVLNRLFDNHLLS